MRLKKKVLCTQVIITVYGSHEATTQQIRKVEQTLDENVRLLLADIKKVKPQAKPFTFRLSK